MYKELTITQSGASYVSNAINVDGSVARIKFHSVSGLTAIVQVSNESEDWVDDPDSEFETTEGVNMIWQETLPGESIRLKVSGVVTKANIRTDK